MAFFKFRKNSPSPQDAPASRGGGDAPAETVESLRRRALYRLIGAAVLVLVAIIGFPLLFDTQPRPVAVQAPIVIPDRNAVLPLTPPASAAAAHIVSAPVLPATSQVPAPASLAAGEEMVVASGTVSASETAAPAASSAAPAPQKAQQGARAKQQQQPAKQQATQSVAEKRKANAQAKRQRSQAADAARARALLDGQEAAPASGGAASAHDANAHAQQGRYVIQIGAFASAQSAQAARQKATHAGVKAYTQTVTTSAGQRIRVRAGPLASRDEAERELAKLKQAGLTGSIVSP